MGKTEGWMKSALVLACALAFGFGFGATAGVGDGSFLLRVGRLSLTDRIVLLDRSVPVVMELSGCSLAMASKEDMAELDKLGYTYDVLDSSPKAWEYYQVGLRPDSNLKSILDLGTVIHTEENWVLLRVVPGTDLAPLFDARALVTPVPREPIAKPRPSGSLSLRPPGPQDAVPLVQQMVASVSNADIMAFWNTLAPPNGTPVPTRYTTVAGCGDESTYCYSTMSGYGIATAYQDYSPGTRAKNVIGTLTGAITPSKVYIVTAHLDDMPSSGYAPGANDNGSGSVIVLESAKVLSCYAFKSTVKFINVTGEETGLEGSGAYAADAASRGENIQGVFAMDMPGWAGDGLPASGENLDLNYDANSQSLGLFYAQCATDYATGLPVDAFLCPSLNASDHYPFWQHGYRAVCGITDNEGYCGHAGNAPGYHTSGDTIANCGDLTFYYKVVRTTVAALAELAEPFKITLDKTAYACSGTVQIIVGDRDLNTNTTTAQTVNVSISSTYEAAPETVTLTEDGVNSMIFKGAITLTQGAPVNGDGQLSVANGSTITASYTDALDCNGAVNVAYAATAPSCTPPVISNVQVTNIAPTTATVTWTTNVQANSRVTYGTAVPPGTNLDDLTNYVTSHSITLTGLTQCTPYYFSVTSTDAGGNTATDTNGGSYYSFTTLGATYAMGPDDVEGGAGSWVATGTPNAWHVDTCRAASAAHAWKAGASDAPACTAEYVATSDNYLTWSANITLGAAGHGYHLRFNEWYDTESNTGCTYDPVRPQVSTDGGTNWTTLATNCGASGGWIARDYDLAAYTGSTVRIRFWFHSDSSAFGEGWFVDDIEISKTQSCTAEMTYQATTFSDTCSGTGGGSNDGILDAGEDVTVHPLLKNAGSQGATGISATLSTGTAGITITNATAGYPDLAAGASAACNAPHFSFSVGTGVACGTVIDFTLTITAATGGGPWTQNFSMTVGNSVPGGTVTDFGENFSSVTTPNLPAGWTASNTSGNVWRTATTACTTIGLQYPYNASSGANSWVYTPGISLATGTTYTLAFNQKVQSASFPEIFEVKAGAAATPAGQTITVLASATYTNTTCTARSATFTVPSTGTYYIGFHCTSAADMYYLWIDDVLLSHTSTPSCTMNACTPSGCTAPGAPALNSAAGTCSGVDLAWTVGTGTTNAYNVYRSGNASCPVGTLTKLNAGPIPSGTLSYSDTTAVPGTTYTYVVRGACNASGVTESANSNCRAAVRLAAPAAPTGVSAIPGCTGNSISWSGSAGATSYNVVRGTSCGTAVTAFTGVTSPYNDTSAVAGTTYNYWVVALNACGSGANSTCATAIRPETPVAPGAPAVADVDGCTLTGVRITWGVVSGATGYDLRVDGGTIVSGVTSPTTYSPGDTGNHTYEIRAANACGNGSFSGATGGADGSAGPPPVLRHYLEKMGLNLLIRWTPLADPGQVDTYEVMRALSPTGPFDVRVGTTTGIETGLSVDMASQPAVAYYKVRAIKGSCVGSLDGE